MVKTALITGASGGIGYELAKVFAANNHDLILVARSIDKLQRIQDELTKTHGLQVHVIGCDLSQIDAPQLLFERIQQQQLTVDVLVNNAGFGDYGPFADCDWAKQIALMQLNMGSLTHLIRLCLPPMLERGYGKILNVASTAAFQPGPFMATYYASKSYVMSFTEALAHEIKGTGVTATVLCPGPTRGTGFQARAELGDVDFFKKFKLPAASEVAQFGYAALERNQVVAVHGFFNQLLVFTNRLMPRQLVTNAVGQLQAPPEN
ncbi:short-chain dehydrogenase reductase sdr [Leptolyngbya sp. Heron Island J]|uniref:SDR family NAD(P)-dependent oxidoreductase n=1 Tax=Leptolyngbya sp. Heron Island J TaxID=1385935 RepID=UPI0003B9E2F5|nr:SDR family oxidoreductase [Leptolyngbya sp. Heron Island J]ESA34279.1 short-chain dehydrogenase reductase sdr [Leptolyngbya sp. Heron Island J]